MPGAGRDARPWFCFYQILKGSARRRAPRAFAGHGAVAIGALNGFVLDSLRGVRESLQYNDGAHRLAQINQRTDALAGQERRLKESHGGDGLHRQHRAG